MPNGAFPKSHPVLAEHVRRTFGDKCGLLVASFVAAAHKGLRYTPQYVITDTQITGLVRGARALVAKPLSENS